MDAFDKALMWASGGAFVFSLSVTQFFVKDPVTNTRWFLFFGWLFLLLTIVIEVGNPYSVTRMATNETASVIAQYQTNDAERAERMWGRSKAWGLLTKVLNESSYLILIVAIYYIAVYVVTNVFIPRELINPWAGLHGSC